MSCLIQQSKQEFMQADIKLFSEKRQEVFITAGIFIRINMVIVFFVSGRRFSITSGVAYPGSHNRPV